MSEQSGRQAPFEDHRPGTPSGVTPADVGERSEIARFLGLSAFPGDRDGLVAVAADNGATDHVLARLRGLPGGETYGNLGDVARALGIGEEAHRA